MKDLPLLAGAPATGPVTLMTSGRRTLELARRLLFLALQVSALVGLNALAEVIAPHLPLPLPANLVGMVLLIALLLSGLVKVQWLGRAADLFQLHMALFFVPIAVGLMAYGTLIRQHGVALALVLLVSTAAGLATAAWIGSWLIPPKESFQLET